MSKEAAGTIVSLWHYPVKSMLGEELNAADLSERGVVGDRAYALVDRADGKVGSAKNPRKWSALFDCRARFADSPPSPWHRQQARPSSRSTGRTRTASRTRIP